MLLSGVRVIDLCQYIPGPFASLKMVAMGAEVIKIEPPGGDPMRTLGAAPGAISALYTHLNRGKRVIEIDLKSAAGKQQLQALTESADVLLEGFRPGVLARLGFSYAALQEINPALIICSISGFGQTGERAQRAGHDLGYGAWAGLYTQAAKGDNPQPVFPPVADHAAALDALAKVSAALYQRTRSGVGCVLDISIAGTPGEWSYLHRSPELAAQLSGQTACYNIYQTADGRYISLAALEDKFWRAFCEAAGQPEWADRQHEELPQSGLIGELQALVASRTLAQWQALLDRVDCCFETVLSPEEILARAAGDQAAGEPALSEPEFPDSDKIAWRGT